MVIKEVHLFLNSIETGKVPESDITPAWGGGGGGVTTEANHKFRSDE